MNDWKSKLIITGLAISLYSVMALAGCSGSGNNGGNSVPFSALHGDAVGVSARFKSPSAITTDGTNLYVADSGNSTIRKVVIATGMVSTIAGSILETGLVDGTGSAARFNSPFGIVVDSTGTNLYVADTLNSAVRKVVIATGIVTTLAGSSAQLNYPEGVAIYGTNFYVADTKNNIIKEVVIATGTMTVLAGSAIAGSTDGTGSAAQFYAPEGIATDGAYLYVTDTNNNTIRQVEIASGIVTTLAGTAGVSGSNDGTTGAAAQFNSPSGVATDGTYLYVADTANNTIRTVVIATGQVTTLAGTAGASGSSDGTGSAARFKSPFGITTDGTNLYVADTNNNTIRKVVISSGVVTTIAGTAP